MAFSFNSFANVLNDTAEESGVTFANLAKKWEKESDGNFFYNKTMISQDLQNILKIHS